MKCANYGHANKYYCRVDKTGGSPLHLLALAAFFVEYVVDPPAFFDSYGGLTLVRKAPSSRFRWEPVGSLPFLFTPHGGLYLGHVTVGARAPLRWPYLIRLDVSHLSSPNLAARIADVFSDRFHEALIHRMQVLAKIHLREPLFVGFLLESDLRGLIPASGPDNLLTAYLSLSEDAPGRIRAEEFLQQEGDPDGTLSTREIAAFDSLVLEEMQRQVRNALPKEGRSIPVFVLPPKANAPDG
jgi:hypothetical protein